MRGLEEIKAEYVRARLKHAPLKSRHEGYAVLLEEIDELWYEIKHGSKERAREEAIQSGAMVLAMLEEVL